MKPIFVVVINERFFGKSLDLTNAFTRALCFARHQHELNVKVHIVTGCHMSDVLLDVIETGDLIVPNTATISSHPLTLSKRQVANLKSTILGIHSMLLPVELELLSFEDLEQNEPIEAPEAA